MKLTVLIDNNTLIDRYFLGEPGVSYLIEDEGKKILFDVGYSNAFITNAQKMAISLLDLDFVVLSHGHLDHTWGLPALVQLLVEGIIEELAVKRPTLIAHPAALLTKAVRDYQEIGSLFSEDKLSKHFDLQLSKEPVHLTERLTFLGEIARGNDFEAEKPIGKVVVGGEEEPDYLMDDTALAYQSPEGLIIITGCSHAGICNIVEHAKKQCGDDRILDIIGGFHLLEPSAEQLEGTIRYMESLKPELVHACHCTDLSSKIALSKAVNLQEVGVGLALEY